MSLNHLYQKITIYILQQDWLTVNNLIKSVLYTQFQVSHPEKLNQNFRINDHTTRRPIKEFF